MSDDLSFDTNGPFVFVANIDLTYDETYADADEKDKIEPMAKIIIDFMEAIQTRVENDSSFFLIGKKNNSGLYYKINASNLLEILKSISLDEMSEICMEETIDICFISNSMNHWDRNFLKASEMFSLGRFTMYGPHPQMMKIAYQGYENGDFDTGIEYDGSERAYYGKGLWKRISKMGYKFGDFDVKSYS